MISAVGTVQRFILGSVRPTQVSKRKRLMATATASIENKEKFSSAKPLKQIPGPSAYRVIKENIFGKKQNVTFKYLEEEFGDIIRISLPFVGDRIFIKKPEDIQKLLTKDGKYPIKPGFDIFVAYRNLMRKELYTEIAGLIGHHGEKWWEFRSKVQQDMLRPKSAMFYIKVLEDISLELIEILRNKRDDNNEVDDLLSFAHQWALESISAIFLDTRLGCFDENQVEDSDSRCMLDANAVLLGQDAMKMVLFPFWRYYPFSFYRRFDEAMTTMYQISKKHIELAMEKIKQEECYDIETGKSVLAKLIAKCGTQSQVPVVMAMDAFLAGIDTTGNTGTMFLYNLAINPEKQEVLHREIFSLVGSSGNVTESSLNKMKYLRASLRESMRMFSSISNLSRRTQVDMVLSGYLIPAGTWVFTYFNNNNMDKDNFPEPEKFLPERWLRGCPAQQKAHPFANLSFAHGPRMCIGKRFAELEMMMLTVKMIQKFRLEYHHEPIGWETNFTVKPDRNVKLKLVERK